jgi:hypothetical protein
MALYVNTTRFDAIVTLRITAVQDAKDVLKVGIESAMKTFGAEAGVIDIFVGPGEVVELSQGVSAEFLAARCAP